MKRAFLAAAAAAFLLHLADNRLGAQTTPPDDLKFFKNYFVTGDYVVAASGSEVWETRAAWPLATFVSVGNSFNDPDDVCPASLGAGVPEGAEIVSAQLYWQVVTDTGPEEGPSGTGLRWLPARDRPAGDRVRPRAVRAEVMTFAGAAPFSTPWQHRHPAPVGRSATASTSLRFLDVDTRRVTGQQCPKPAVRARPS